MIELEKWSAVWQLQIAVRKFLVLPIVLRDTSAKPRLKLLGNTLPVSNIVKDLGILIDPQLKFGCQVNAKVAKAHSRACLIHNCFLSKNQKSLAKAFVTYVRPLVEYASCIWSPSTKTLIKQIESIQKRFTKRMRVMANLTYKQRLEKLGLEGLKRRRLCLDLIFVYKILFGLTDLNASDFFVIRTGSITRGHPYRLVKPRCSINARRDIFSVRVINPWNSLPATAQDFKSRTCFKCFLKKVDLTKCTCF